MTFPGSHIPDGDYLTITGQRPVRRGGARVSPESAASDGHAALVQHIYATRVAPQPSLPLAQDAYEVDDGA